MRNNKKAIVVISIIMVMIVIAIVLTYLYMATDFFRGKKELFFKYIAQNKDSFYKVSENESIKNLVDIKSENKYESHTNIECVNSEGGEISNPFNNLSLALDIQKDNEQQYFYIDGQILYDGEKYLEAELIKQNEQYGVRFADAVIQFLSIELDENIESIAEEIGIEKSQLELLINIIDGNIELEQLTLIKDKYFNIINNIILNGKFEKQKNAIITYNENTIKTNAYSVELSKEQIQEILIEVLNIGKEEKILEILEKIIDKEEILRQIEEITNKVKESIEVSSIKITVYEQKQKTIRTIIEMGVHKIIIENVEQENSIITNINYSNLVDENDIELIFKCQKQVVNNEVKVNMEISQKRKITTKSLKIENIISVKNNFEKTETLTSSNYLVINSIKNEAKRKEIIELLKKIVPEKVEEKIKLLKEKLGIDVEQNENNNQENIQTEENEVEMSQVEINKFNAKFEFYTGEEVSAEKVKKLLEIVKNNNSGYIIGSATDEDNEEKKNITIYIKKDNFKEETETKIQKEIKENKKYKVSIMYENEKGLIDYITISEV